ncbi:DUF2971 domain-containing protein [Bradyrhizobium sp. 14AA]
MGVNHIWSRGFCRPRMWQQYGDNYRGVCMVYDRQALDDAIPMAGNPMLALQDAARCGSGCTAACFHYLCP